MPFFTWTDAMSVGVPVLDSDHKALIDLINSLHEGLGGEAKYTDRGVRRILAKYVEIAGIKRNISPHRLRHFLLTWLKKQGIDDALIQPYSGHATRQSLEVYSKLSIHEAQQHYDQVMNKFPI